MWPLFYIAAILFSVYSGYHSTPQEGSDTLGSKIFSVVSIGIATTAFPLLAVYYALKRGQEVPLKRPRWSIQPLGWSTNVLQPLRVTVVGTGTFLAGKLAALWQGTVHEDIQLYCLSGVAVGLFTGERLVYYIFRNQIAKTIRKEQETNNGF